MSKSSPDSPKYCEIKRLDGKGKTGRWWEKKDSDEKEEKDGSVKWTTLKHNGVVFPAPYEPLPKGIQVKYKGKPVVLDAVKTNNPFHVTAEEAAVFMAMEFDKDERLSTKNAKRKRTTKDVEFMKNFWNDWKQILGKNHTIQNLKDVDFSAIQKYISQRSDKKKEAQRAKSKEEKAKEKEEKKGKEDIYNYAIIDGSRIKFNPGIQPPGLYIGHGEQPLRGRIKGRIMPEDVTLNISRDSVPKCFINGKPCKWGKIEEDHLATWIAMYPHPITRERTYVWLKREESHFVCNDDMEKFDKARALDKNIDKIRKKYTEDLKAEDSTTRELATAVYLLDILAIRPGTEKDETKEAGTLGLTTLKCDNVKFLSNNKITIDFIGKSSIQFVKTFSVSKEVYTNLKEVCKKYDELFPHVTANSLNAYLKKLLPSLTAKVFRTWKASSILQKELDKNMPKVQLNTYEKRLIYDQVNMEVALQLNHKRMGSDDERVKKLQAKVEEAEAKLEAANTDRQKLAGKKRVAEAKQKLAEADQNIALATSKTNYLDPRITVVWAKKAEMPIEKLYNKVTLKKFIWAMDTDTKWKF
jgi:DNA topoisomerase-1